MRGFGCVEPCSSNSSFFTAKKHETVTKRNALNNERVNGIIEEGDEQRQFIRSFCEAWRSATSSASASFSFCLDKIL